MRSLSRWSRVAALVLGALLGLPGCAFSGINLVQDHRVEIVAPREQAALRAGPLTIRWTAEDVADLRFGVFIDRTVLRPGDTLKDLVDDEDAACLARPDCPDEAWLSGEGIHITSETSLVVDSLKDNRPEYDTGGRDKHTVAIVLLDGDRRIGESAWYREFYVDRGAR